MPVFTDYPTFKGTSLSDLLGSVQGVQNFQQQQQLMPIQLEKAQLEIQKQRANTPLEIEAKALELQKLRELTPSDIERSKAESEKIVQTKESAITSAKELAKQAQIQTQKDQFSFDKDYTQAINQVIGGYVNDPRIKSKNPMEVMSVIKDVENHVKEFTKGDPEGELKTELRFAPIKKMIGDKKHESVEQVFKNLIQSGITPTSQQALQTPALTTVGGVPATFTSATGTAQPLNIGGQPPQMPQGQLQGGPLPQGMGLPQGAPQGVTSTQMSLPYPVRRAGDIRPLAPNETKDTEANFTYRNNLSNGQLNLSKSKRNLDDVIKDAGQIKKEDFFSSGWAGTATRNLKSIAGDPKYKELSKAIASVQISNLQAQGADMSSDAGKSLQRLSTGDETYPPDILIGVARKTYAEVQNLDMQANGAAKFAQKYGDNNLSAFKRMWSANADNKVFEAMTIFDNVKDKTERNKAINELLGSNPQARQQFYNKYNNIKKLTETGEL